ncbi:MAG: hypothetical protein WBP94_07540 [Rhodomicrobiaceae bacterium]
MSTINIVVTFLLVTLFGNYLLSAWQYRTWLRQRRFEAKSNLLNSLHDLYDDLVSLMSRRRYAMLKVVYALRQKNPDRVDAARAVYEKCLDEWNSKFNSLLIKVIFYLDTEEFHKFEDEINSEFVDIGRHIDLCLRRSDNSTTARLADIEARLNYLNHKIINITRTIYGSINRAENREIFVDDKLLKENEYAEAPTWILFRNLFRTRA